MTWTSFKQCGKDDDAKAWAVILIELLGCEEVLSPEAVRRFKHGL